METGSRYDDMIENTVQEALAAKYSWADDWDEENCSYEFSVTFHKGMKKAFAASDRKYVSIDRFRMRRAAAALLITAALMALAGCTYAVTQAVINWNEKQNDRNGTLDVYFDIDDPDSTLEDKGLRKPETPAGYEIVSEEKDEDGAYYTVEYDNNGSDIIYSQDSNVENMGLSINNENNHFKEININGYKGYYSRYDETGAISLVWTDGIYLYGVIGRAPEATLKEMAESLK